MAGIVEKTASGVITTSKAFIAAHPVSLAIVGGGAIAAGAYYWMKKRKAADTDTADANDADVDTAEAATA